LVALIKIEGLDHFVLTVENIEKTCSFYSTVLGMDVISFQNGRKALKFGKQKINLHESGNEFEPKAQYPTPGSADLCFVTETSMTDIINHLNSHGAEIIEGPIQRTGAVGKLNSVYVRDPDNNLVEISVYI
jgi:catechol 2,3-dioxygenase-like lactoylglutathione lyase family enzyme